ncbi:centrosomal protein of 44 kDa isoform X1 [Amia ocellicauda]|uniref:centrosomal protein of 44 kDa isoform X1 n=1 Tax=Amia ocellicauda TaxID=2972642 RepID=UPI0034643E7E
MATGDLRGCLRKLDQQLRLLNYSREVDYAGLAKGDPSSFLPIVSHAFVSYSSHLAEHLVGFGAELAGKNDLRFVESVYKVLRDLFNYKPVLTKQQFLQFGYAERKVNILCDIIGFVAKKHKELSKAHKSKFQPQNKRPFLLSDKHSKPERPLPERPLPETTISQTKALSGRPYAERHINPARVPSVSASSASDSEGSERDSSARGDGIATAPSVPPVMADSREWKSVETRLAECQCRLEKLSAVEGRLEMLERRMAGKVTIDRGDWENLVSRVLLLETELALRSRQELSARSVKEKQASKSQDTAETRSETPETLRQGSSGYSSVLSSDTSPSATDINSFVLTEVSKATTKERLERITSMMEETAALLKCTEKPV